MKKIFFILFNILIFVVSCIFVSCNKNEPICPSSVFYLTPSQIIKNKRLVEKGNPEAAFKLNLYYEFCTDDQESALYWLKKASDLGHVIAKQNLELIQEERKKDFNNE